MPAETSIPVSRETWRDLTLLKLKLQAPTLDDVIRQLLAIAEVEEIERNA